MNIYDTKLKFLYNLAIVDLGDYKLPVAFNNSTGNKTKKKKHNLHISFNVADGQKPRIIEKIPERYFDTFGKAVFNPKTNRFTTSLRFTGEIIEASIVDEDATDYYTGFSQFGMHLTIKAKKITFPVSYTILLHVKEDGKIVGRSIDAETDEADGYFELPKVGDIISGVAEVNGFLINEKGEKL